MVVAATLCYTAWNASRRNGMLKSFDWIGAKETMENRIRGSLSKANDGLQWGSVLFRGLNVEMAQELHPEEMEWWQVNSEAVSPPDLRQPATFTKLLAAFRTLLDNNNHIFSKQEVGPQTAETLSPEIE